MGLNAMLFCAAGFVLPAAPSPKKEFSSFYFAALVLVPIFPSPIELFDLSLRRDFCCFSNMLEFGCIAVKGSVGVSCNGTSFCGN